MESAIGGHHVRSKDKSFSRETTWWRTISNTVDKNKEVTELETWSRSY